MSKLDRFNGLVQPFAVNSTGTERTVFGDTTQSNAIDDNLNADFLTGWQILAAGGKPPKQWFNAIHYTLGYLASYLYQEGIAEWNTSQEFYVGSLTKRNGITYESISGTSGFPNIGNDPALDTTKTNWVKSGIIETQVITSSTTYNPPVGVKALKFIVTGGGGGGGGVDGQGAGTVGIAGSGSGGATAIKSTSNIESSYSLVVGAGGGGGAAGDNNGTNGGASSVTSSLLSITAGGGLGGLGALASSASSNTGGTAGGIASGGDLNIDGGASGYGYQINGTINMISIAGGSFFGTGRNGRVNSDAIASLIYGVGGSGSVVNPLTTNNYAGGNGANGIIIIEEYY